MTALPEGDVPPYTPGTWSPEMAALLECPIPPERTD